MAHNQGIEMHSQPYGQYRSNDAQEHYNPAAESHNMPNYPHWRKTWHYTPEGEARPILTHWNGDRYDSSQDWSTGARVDYTIDENGQYHRVTPGWVAQAGYSYYWSGQEYTWRYDAQGQYHRISDGHVHAEPHTGTEFASSDIVHQESHGKDPVHHQGESSYQPSDQGQSQYQTNQAMQYPANLTVPYQQSANDSGRPVSSASSQVSSLHALPARRGVQIRGTPDPSLIIKNSPAPRDAQPLPSALRFTLPPQHPDDIRAAPGDPQRLARVNSQRNMQNIWNGEDEVDGRAAQAFQQRNKAKSQEALRRKRAGQQTNTRPQVTRSSPSSPRSPRSKRSPSPVAAFCRCSVL